MHRDKWKMRYHPYMKSYQDLLVVDKAREMAVEVTDTTKSFPREEMHALTK